MLVLPVSPVATELFDLAGRWGRERAPQRAPLVVGTHARENRRGRTGPDAPLVLAAGTAGFGTRGGEVWAVHVAWSGNHVSYAERLSTGAAVLGGGELLLPGEIVLAAGESYTGPWVYAAHSADGLDGIAARCHTHLRARRHHPRRPRPVVLNTWEAVYFDHDLARLTELARLAAEVGVERYVLDDGWFRHRRDDTAGLGDWYVDEAVWPDGLHPLVDAVRGLGMEFGLWVEPEMVNPDSDLARAHPEWLLATGGRRPLPSRNQQVLDLGQAGAHAYVLERLDALLTSYDIAYLKWDHNRDLLDAGSGPDGVPGVAAQTRAVHGLLDELRARHPRVEIESCSSGGLRVDLEILERTDRVWGSDVIDPLERQQIQRWTAQLLPPELVGSHVGAPRSHTTGHTHDLSFRAGTALFGSFGIEWDLTAASEAERAELAAWVALVKELRGLLHTGTVVGPTRRTRPPTCTGWSPLTPRTRCSRWSSSRRAPPRCPGRCACRASTRRGATASPPRPPATRPRCAAPRRRGWPGASCCRGRCWAGPGSGRPRCSPSSCSCCAPRRCEPRPAARDRRLRYERLTGGPPAPQTVIMLARPAPARARGTAPRRPPRRAPSR